MDTFVSFPSEQFKIYESSQGSIEHVLRTSDELHEVVVNHIHPVINGDHPFADAGHLVTDTSHLVTDTSHSSVDAERDIRNSPYSAGVVHSMRGL